MLIRFEATELFDFLRRVDAELSEPTAVMLIGGSAIAVIDPSHSTTDIDLLSPGSIIFTEAVERLRARGEAVLPVQIVGLAELPENAMTRAHSFAAGFDKLSILVLEQHDLAMSKLARGYEHDIEALETVHRVKPFILTTLLERFHETETIGPRRRFALALLDLIERLFGKEAAEEHRALLDNLHW